MVKWWVLSILIVVSGLEAKIPRLILLHSPSYIGGAGMFHNFNIVLGCLDLYDTQDHLALTIDFETQGLYYDGAYGSNWWSYYFTPLHYPFKKGCGNKKPLVKMFSDAEKGNIGNRAHFFLSRLRAYELIQKYIQIKPDILEEVDAFYNQELKGYEVIGIHYRSTDKWLEATHVSYQDVIDVLDKLLKKNPQTQYKIFIATDEVTFLETMKKRYQVCYTQAQRLDGYPIHYASDKGYLKGKEALIDCLLLAKSHILIRTNSNLSAVSAYFNPLMTLINLNTVHEHVYQGLQHEGSLNELNIKTNP